MFWVFKFLNDCLHSDILLDRGADGFKVNTQSHLLPVLATSVKVKPKLYPGDKYSVHLNVVNNSLS